MSKLKGTIFMIRSMGLESALNILGFTLRRGWLNRAYRRSEAARRRLPLETPGRLSEVQATPKGAYFKFDHSYLQVDLLASDLARLFWQPGPSHIPYALAKTEWPEVPITLSEVFEGWRLASQALQILIHNDGSVQFLDINGSILRDELPPLSQGKPDSQAWICQTRLRPEECLFGLGEQAGRLNLRGTHHYLWSQDPGGSYGPGADPIYMPIPLYMSLHQDGGYLVFYENPFPSRFSFDDKTTGTEQVTTVTFEGGPLCYYVIAAQPAPALERYSELTGRPDLPPLWSLGYHQSRWGYKNEGDIRRVMAGFKEHNLPLSAIHLDIDYMAGYRVFTVDQERFPDLKNLAQELDEQGVKLVTIIDPGVKQDPQYFLYQEGLNNGAFCTLPDGKPSIGVVWPGSSVYPDFTHPETRSWWGAQYKSMLEAGIAGFWHDMNEPTSFAAWGGLSLPYAIRHHLEGNPGDHRQAHNLYALLMNRAGYEALRKYQPEHRPWIVSRSGWASQQRYAWNWTGDTSSTWDSLRMTIASVLGVGLSGLPFTGPDIGGFSGNPSAELYLRWFQLAAFLPFFRTHSAIGTDPREPWIFGEPYTHILGEFLRLRYRLLPYLYTLAWQASQTGAPLARPLFWIDPADQRLWAVDDAFLLGDALLIAPVLEEGQTRRKVQLPHGRWYSLWDKAAYQGPGAAEMQAPLERIPVLVHGSNILPLADNDHLTLHIYPPEGDRDAPAGSLYSDAGDGYGPWRLDRFIMQRIEKTLEIAWSSEGDYPFPYPQVNIQLHGLQAQHAWINDQPIPIKENHIESGAFSKLRIEA